MWEIHPVLSRNATVRNVKIASHGPNNDGCDPESCADVLIDNYDFDTGDDCIALESGRNRAGRRLAVRCENIVVRVCRMKDGQGGVEHVCMRDIEAGQVADAVVHIDFHYEEGNRGKPASNCWTLLAAGRSMSCWSGGWTAGAGP